ncbi:kelch-like protein 8 [Styela clava]
MEFDLGIDENEHKNIMMTKLDDLRIKKRHSDLTIKVGSEEFLVHKNMMSAGSDYFHAMLSHDNLETNTGIVDMQDVDVESVKICIDYIYTGKASITLEKSEQLLRVATLMQLSVLCEKIAEFLKAHINSKSFFNIKQLATLFDNANLETICDNYAVSNMGAILLENEFKLLDMDYILFLISTKNQSYSEDSKLAALLIWIKADVENRRENFVSMLQQLNQHNISSNYIRYLTENESLCFESAECMKLFVTIMVSESTSIPASVPQHSTPIRNALAVFDKSSSTLRTYKPAENKWAEFCKLEADRVTGNFTSVLLHDYLYLIKQDRKVYRINMNKEDSSWDELASLIGNHGGFITATVHNGVVYVGGENAIEQYSYRRNEWIELLKDDVVRTQYTLIGSLDHIYCLGGHSKVSLKNVTKYCTETGIWSSVNPMRFARRTPAVAVYADSLYAAGGYNEGRVTHAECFDLKTQTWVTLKPMAIPRTCFRLCVIGSELFAVGGEETGTNSIEKFNLSEKTWHHVTNPTGMDIRSMATESVRIND